MKVLLTHHFPLDGSSSGVSTLGLATGLIAAGHQVECLIVDNQRKGTESFPVDRITCLDGDASADLNFDIPCFVAAARDRQRFAQLSNPQLNRYREILRARLDRVIERFEPDLVHCQHIWLQAHLVLESGAPYVISAPGDELLGYAEDPRYRPFATQAAENAGRILAASDAVRQEVLTTFDLAGDRLESAPWAFDAKFGSDAMARIEQVYRQVLAERFGP